MIDYLAEEDFYSRKFYFSYSGLNKLLYSPSIFYKHYVLNQQEERTDAHLVEGKLLHCLLLEESKFNDQFVIMPGSVPTGQSKAMVNRVYELAMGQHSENLQLKDFEDQILQVLQEMEYHQRLKTDAQRIEKVLTEDAVNYFEFLKSRGNKDVIDEETLQRTKEYADVVRSNSTAMATLNGLSTDTLLSEFPLKFDLPDKPFGIKGILDRVIVSSNGIPSIVDLKTTGKSIVEFKDTVEFYNYWLQAAIYDKLVRLHFNIPTEQHVDFTFVVIDKYQQVYSFPVEKNTMLLWREKLEEKLKIAEYHYSNRAYSLPYEFAVGQITL
jgi:hypothetical protein